MKSSISEYLEYVRGKKISDVATGFDVELTEINCMLFDFQKRIVQWSCKRGRSAIFADCGLGKTPMQLDWARLVHEHTGGNVLIVAPLAVAQQTKSEGDKFGIPVEVCREQADVVAGVNITNYEVLHKFDAASFIGIVLDESSILKSISGKQKQFIIENYQQTPYKLACTATPSPNDLQELGNHAEFLNIMKSTEMLSFFFYNDGSSSAKWHLKGHAEKEYWKWVASWAIAISKPSDMGCDDAAFKLPEMNIIEHIIDTDYTENAGDQLVREIDLSATGYHREKRISSEERSKRCADIVYADAENQWLVWCDTNFDADALHKNMPDAVEVRGNDSNEKKTSSAFGFAHGEIKKLISKPSIFGFGMNFQACHNVVFCGMSYSYESFYQATRRVWRFGQVKPVNVHVVYSEAERSIMGSIKRKEKQFEHMKKEMLAIMLENHEIVSKKKADVQEEIKTVERGKNWTLYNSDCVVAVKEIPNESIGLSVFSPPFASLYTYSDSPNDMGNCTSDEDFYHHFRFMVKELLRITKPGRNCCIHVMQLPMTKARDGVIGIRDFRGEIIRMFVEEGWIYHSEVTIWKDPVTAMQRTKALGLLYKQLMKDSARCRQGIADYLIVMRKEGDNLEPVTHDRNDFPVTRWQDWASPVWMDIKQSNTLQKERDEKDEKHICPLQLDVIERAVILWSNEGDVVFSPFAGIGSEGHQSILLKRKFIGIELKETYFIQAVSNLKKAEQDADLLDKDLVSMMGE